MRDHPVVTAAASFSGVGVDVERVARFVDPDLTAFSVRERDHCLRQAVPAESFAGRWCAKEAVVKVLGGVVGMRDVEILAGPRGEPMVLVAGQPVDVRVSIAHDAETAAAVAVQITRRALA